MYSQEDHAQIRKQLQKRWIVTALPSVLLILSAIVVFVICQVQRKDWGWIFACVSTILGGGYFLFFFGVYLRPMMLYQRHVGYMLDGHKRETKGILTDVSSVPCDKDGLDWYAVTVNVGEKQDPEDDRLLYYDALKGKPAIPLGTRVMALSNDRMISDLREA